MLDIFFTEDLRGLLRYKSIVFMGDSNMRGVYKDFLCLLERNRLIPMSNLKAKMERTVFGDKLKNINGRRTNGRTFREEREYKDNNVQASFYFLTRVYNEYVKNVLEKITLNKKPDVLIINSLLWDVTRWGTEGVDEYKLNLITLMEELKLRLPDCLVIWMTTLPISQELKGGFLVQDLQFLKYSLRFHVVEANHFARKVVVEHGFDVVDIHYHLKLQIHRRAKDGIHWTPGTVRYITNLLLTHICLSWDVPLPHRYNSPILAENLEKLDDMITEVETPVKVPEDRLAIKSHCMAAKPAKEGYDTPTPERGKQNKPFRGASIHAYFKKIHQEDRIKRIREWRADVHNSISQLPPSPHYDSEYFLSPIKNCDSPTSKRNKQNKCSDKQFGGTSHYTNFNRNQQEDRIDRKREWRVGIQSSSYQSSTNPHHDSGYLHSLNEICDTSTPKTNKQKKRPYKPFWGPSHHVYSNRNQQKGRINYIQQRRGDVQNSTYQFPPNPHQDSGYYHSPIKKCDTPTPNRKKQSKQPQKRFKGTSHHVNYNRNQQNDGNNRNQQCRGNIQNSSYQSLTNSHHDSKYSHSPDEIIDTPERNKHNLQPNKRFGGTSHHFHFNSNQQDRTNRSQQYQSDIPNSSYQPPTNPHNDSGYLPSSNEAYMCNNSLHSTQRNFTYSKPQCSQTVYNFQNDLNSNIAHSPSSPKLPSEPYKFFSRFQFGVRRTLLQDPYVFSHAQESTTDFTNDNFVAYKT